MLAGEKLSRAIEARVNFIKYQEQLLAVADPPQHAQEIPWRHDFAAPSLNRFDKNAPDLSLSKCRDDLLLQFLETARRTIGKGIALQAKSFPASKRAPKTAGIGQPHGKSPKLALKRLAKGGNPDRFQGAETETVIASCKRDDARLAAVKKRGF